jgi:hypothetical protein
MLKKDGMKRIKRIFKILQEEKELYGELISLHNKTSNITPTYMHNQLSLRT